MEQFLTTLFFGKPRKGEPVNYSHTVQKPVVPFNLSYECWQWSVTNHGYETFLEFLQKIYK
jgi:hypothetical protein